MLWITILIACQDKEPLTCEFAGESYAVGESFDAADGCNICSCDAYDGEVMVDCSAMDCSAVDDPGLAPDCKELSVSECETANTCHVITGSQVVYDDENECFAWANSVEQLGCMDATMGCGDAITLAASSADPTTCYGFSNTCIPDGWIDCVQESFPDCD